VCVCVSIRERDRERERSSEMFHLFHKYDCSNVQLQTKEKLSHKSRL